MCVKRVEKFDIELRSCWNSRETSKAKLGVGEGCSIGVHTHYL